ncbi:hypothetical protein [Mucilaginibacter phyllosphaerae]|uniref:Bacteriocin n=1 Tax=Mucilaginibacter phyllosphaerae TaxID=1812349 RepID=A0A4Y8AD84_9SPHI|nr:hypothetical protein [Mucilaginibacter phyllosphaerae]MBB3969237.1 hypothetical protein [Mucilaginibacter phyllosphaerae]TEW65962.1 hypothetical protein E2R65_12595 [Mucilaginibacter phyllosphaerae]
MTKLSRKEMKTVAGGVTSNRNKWTCYGSSYQGYVTTCADFNPTSYCSGCGYSDCVDTGVRCSTTTLCVC